MNGLIAFRRAITQTTVAMSLVPKQKQFANEQNNSEAYESYTSEPKNSISTHLLFRECAKFVTNFLKNEGLAPLSTLSAIPKLKFAIAPRLSAPS